MKNVAVFPSEMCAKLAQYSANIKEHYFAIAEFPLKKKCN